MLDFSKNNLTFRSRYEVEDSSLELTSLLDVIFILLIFFILTSGITQISTEVNLPRTDELLEKTEILEEPVLIELSGEKQSWQINGKEFTDYQNFKKHLLQLYQQRSSTLFMLAPEREMPVEPLIRLLTFFSSHQISNVQIISQWEP